MPYPREHYRYPDEMRQDLDAAILQAGSQVKFGERMGLQHKQEIHDMIHGKRLFPDSILRFLGWERVTLYRRIEK